MVDDEVPLVLVVAKSGRSTAGLRAWVGLAAIDAAVRIPQIHVIENVERFCTELSSHLLCEGEVLKE